MGTGIQPKMLDPDPYQMNTYPKPCLPVIFLPGVDADWAVDEALDVALLDLLLRLGLHVTGHVLPVPVTEHLHRVQQQQVLPIHQGFFVFFLGFLGFLNLIFYENNTNFSL